MFVGADQIKQLLLLLPHMLICDGLARARNKCPEGIPYFTYQNSASKFVDLPLLSIPEANPNCVYVCATSGAFFSLSLLP